MFKRIENQSSLFNKYFREADGDDEENPVSVNVAPRSNRGTDYNDENTNVKVAPRSNRGSDYGEEDTGDSSPDNEESTDTPDTEGETDYTADDGETENNGDEPTDDNTTDDTSSDGTDTEEPVEAPDTEGETDYTADDGETEDSGESSTDDSEEEKPEDSQKRYTMYLRYLRLYDALDSISEKLRYIVKDDPDENAVIIKVTDNINTIRETMFDYMIMKFKSAQYVEILIYFETIINCIRLNFELIRNNKIVLKQ